MTVTIDDLILGIDVEHEQAQRKWERANESIKTTLAKARREGRANLTLEEDNDVQAWQKDKQEARVEIEGIKVKRERALAVQEDEARAVEMFSRTTRDPQTSTAALPAYDQVARVGREERTYHRGNSSKGGMFLRDVIRQHLFRDLEAEQRLSRHMAEERVERGHYLERASDTGNFTGLVVPQYLTELYAPAIAALRPFADVCNKHDLPSNGMTVNISRITTATAVGLQTSQNSATGIGATDIDDTLLTINVLTAAGISTLSRQAIERGTGIEDVTMSDLQRRYATNLDSTLLNQATTGLSAVAQANTYDDTSPTGPEFYSKLLGALSASEAALLAQAQPNFAVMHPRRWYWLSAQMVSTWPMIQQPILPPAAQVTGLNYGEMYGRGVRGVLPNGLLVVTDANVTTTAAGGTGTEDETYVVASDECHLWEDPNAPQFIRAEQPAAGTLGVQLVLYGYFAYTMQRYSNAMQKIVGTGTTTPTF